MINMPESYVSIMKKRGLVAETIYMLPENPRKGTSWFEEANIRSFSTARGVMQVYYVLKSFARPTDDHRYITFIVTRYGIFTSVNSMCAQNEPIDFNVMVVKHFCDFHHGMLMTLRPETREIIILKGYRYTERINGVGVPNTWHWEDHPEIHKDVRKHDLLIESCNTNPIVSEYNQELCEVMRLRNPYIWVRSDNYVDLENVRFCRQPY